MREWEELALDLAAWACERMRSGYSTATTKKHAADWVTSTDREIEQEVRARIGAAFPSHRVVGEEYGAAGTGPVTWYVDPVDGTTNFVHGLGWSSFSLAAADESGAVVGVVADPWRGEIFSAVRGRGARLSGQAIRCAAAEALAGGIVCTELCGGQVWPGLSTLMRTLAERQCGTRIMGSTALSLASVAAGRCTAMVTGGYQIWDVLAAALIARESGAVVLSRAGDPWLGGELPADGLVAGGPEVVREVWQAWR
ncbi:inositol monophosphatase family protein [Nonomuraea sp. NPDC050536]|uniref:inositol monophosphatase family protein n=1 Tax=Nonomuraea sp. NPDC050536 TaxID=3364366 RepID=UPI0037CABAA9